MRLVKKDGRGVKRKMIVQNKERDKRGKGKKVMMREIQYANNWHPPQNVVQGKILRRK